MNTIINTIILSALPISELRGGITYALAYGMKLPWVLLLPIAVNVMIIPFVFVLLNPMFDFLKRYDFFKKYIEKYENRAKKKMDKYDRYKQLGLFLFVAIPLPTTGVYTGIVASIVIGMNRKKAILPLVLGVVVAGIITYLTVSTAESIYNIFG